MTQRQGKLLDKHRVHTTPTSGARALRNNREMAQQLRRRWGANRGVASGYNKSGINNINAQHPPQTGTQGTRRGLYYGPQSTDGRGSNPRNPGHAAAMASNQPTQINTPLQALTGTKSAWGEAFSNSLGTRDIRAHPSSGSTTIKLRIEMLKTTPTETMEILLHSSH